jgi:hypothetical protein
LDRKILDRDVDILNAQLKAIEEITQKLQQRDHFNMIMASVRIAGK